MRGGGGGGGGGEEREKEIVMDGYMLKKKKKQQKKNKTTTTTTTTPFHFDGADTLWSYPWSAPKARTVCWMIVVKSSTSLFHSKENVGATHE